MNVTEQLAAVVGAANITTHIPDQWRDDKLGDRWVGNAACIVFPKSQTEVQEVMRLCHKHAWPVIPQGGNTGTVAGCHPQDENLAKNAILLNLTKINSMSKPIAGTMQVDAGCTLLSIKEKALQDGWFFPLTLGAEGECTIGGNIATNAGGYNVMKYGMARNLILGINVVLADGSLLSDVNSLHKNNSGLDLKQLFIGSEGTLGIITKATLKLFPYPTNVATAMVGCEDLHKAVTLLELCKKHLGNDIDGFEILPKIGINAVRKYFTNIDVPLQCKDNWQILISVANNYDNSLEETLEQVFAKALSQKLINDGIVCQSQKQAKNMWNIREAVVLSQKKRFNYSIRHDISVPVAAIPVMSQKAIAAVEKIVPNCQHYHFGHLGDGNIHLNIGNPETMTANEYKQFEQPICEAVFDIVQQLNGSFSAEHGIGRRNKWAMARYKPLPQQQFMAKIKSMFDPKNIMNPGALYP